MIDFMWHVIPWLLGALRWRLSSKVTRRQLVHTLEPWVAKVDHQFRGDKSNIWMSHVANSFRAYEEK